MIKYRGILDHYQKCLEHTCLKCTFGDFEGFLQNMIECDILYLVHTYAK